MEIIVFLYHLSMLSLCVAGFIIVISSAVVATKRTLPIGDLAQAVIGIVFMGAAIVSWGNGTPVLMEHVPQWFFMLGTFIGGYGGFGNALWALNPELAERMMQ